MIKKTIIENTPAYLYTMGKPARGPASGTGWGVGKIAFPISEDKKIYMYYSADEGDTWSTEAVSGDLVSYVNYGSMIIDSQGNVYCAWTQANDATKITVRQKTDAWQTAEIINTLYPDPNNPVGYFTNTKTPGTCLDKNDKLHIIPACYSPLDSQLYSVSHPYDEENATYPIAVGGPNPPIEIESDIFVSISATRYATQVIISNYTVSLLDQTITLQGTLYSGQWLRIHRKGKTSLFHLLRNGADSYASTEIDHAEETAPGTVYTFLGGAIACDSDGNLHALYEEQSPGSGGSYYVRLKYSKSTNNGATWSTPVYINYHEDFYHQQQYGTLCVDEDGYCHVTYKETSEAGIDNIYYTSQEIGGTWTTPEIISGIESDVYYIYANSLALTSETKTLHAIWAQLSDTQAQLRHAYKKVGDETWSTITDIESSEDIYDEYTPRQMWAYVPDNMKLTHGFELIEGFYDDSLGTDNLYFIKSEETDQPGDEEPPASELPEDAVITIETEPDGSGTIVPNQTILPDATVTIYAIARDADGVFIENTIVDSWQLVDATGGVVAGDLVPAEDLKSAVFTGHKTGSAKVDITKEEYATLPTGTITVEIDRKYGQVI